MTMLLNCDLGESYGSWTMGMDHQVMPFINQANIACGFHGGDPVTIQRTLVLAEKHKVTVGAHPAYPDLVGFGRRSMNLAPEELERVVVEGDGQEAHHPVDRGEARRPGAPFGEAAQ